MKHEAVRTFTVRNPRRQPPRRIAIVTDAWHPQTNGVVRTLETTIARLRGLGHHVSVISAEGRRTIPCPTYPEIRLAIGRRGSVACELAALDPEAIHIATEGPLGLAARRYCIEHARPFTTACHTRFPDYVARRTGLPADWFWRYMRWFHGPASSVMAATGTLGDELRARGIAQIHEWSRGVDLDQFTPGAPPPPEYEALPRPILLYVGRVAVEKNIDAFLACDYPGSKVVVGDGPEREALSRRHPAALFLGSRSGAVLAGCYADADVLVFPSRTDTFGLVMIEAMACGTPVAAFPVQGPLDIVTDETGALSEQLERAIDAARYCSQADCLARAAEFSWERATAQFLEGLALP